MLIKMCCYRSKRTKRVHGKSACVTWVTPVEGAQALEPPGLPETGSQPHLCDLGNPLKPEFNGLISKVRAESRF